MGIAVKIIVFLFYSLSASYFWISFRTNLLIYPFIWTLVYFVLECFSILLYLCDKNDTPDEVSDISSFEGESKKNDETDLFGNEHLNLINQTTKPYVGIKKFSFILPAFIDMVSKLLLFISYYNEGYYSFQPVFSIIVTWIISMITAKKTKLKKRSVNWQTHIGCFFYIIGLVLVIVPGFSTSRKIFILPLFLSLLGESAKIAHFFIQNWYIYPDNGTKPYLEVFYEGIFGTVMTGILVLIFSFIPCPQRLNYCALNDKIVNFSGFVDLIKIIKWNCILIALSFLLYNITGVYTIEKSNVMNRIIIDNLFFAVYEVYTQIRNSSLKLPWLIYIGAGIMLVSAIITCQIFNVPCLKQRRDSIDSEVQKLNPKELYLGEITQ